MRPGRPLHPLVLCAAVFVYAAPTLALERRDSDVQAEVESILTLEAIALPDLFRLAELTSPIIAAARSEVSASAGRVRQAGAYANPSIGVGIEEASVDDFSDRKQVVEIMQPLLLGTRPGPAKAAMSAELTAATQRLQDTRRDVCGQAHALLIAIHDHRARSAVLTELIAEAAKTHDIARKRFEARAVPESHVTRALVERLELEMEGERARSGQLSAVERLGALLGGREIPSDRLAPPPPITEDIEAAGIVDRLRTHPRIAAASRATDAAELRHRWVRARRLPDFDLRAAYGRQMDLDQDFFEAGIGVRLPLFNRNQGEVQEALAGVHQAEQRARTVRSDLVAQLTIANRDRSLAASQLATHRDVLEPAAERGLQQARAAYQAGTLSFLELLDAQQAYARVRIRTLELERDFRLATAELSGLAGLGPYQD